MHFCGQRPDKLIEREIEIVYDLAQRVLQYEKVLLEASDICGQIDR